MLLELDELTEAERRNLFNSHEAFKKKLAQNNYFLRLLWLTLKNIRALFFKFKKKKKLKIKKYKKIIFIESEVPETEEHNCRIPEYHYHRFLEPLLAEEALIEKVPQPLLFAYLRP